MGSEHNRLRIALVITELGIGGAERCLVHLANGLDRNRFDPFVCSLAPRPPEDRDWLVAELEATGTSVFFVGVRRSWQLVSAVHRLRRLFLEESPNLIQTFMFHANVAGALAARRAGVAHVVAGIRVAERGRWRWRLQRALAGRVSRFTCVSHSVAKIARQRGGLPSESITVIPNGIDAGKYPAPLAADLTTMGVPRGRRVIACVGRLDRQKGIDRLVRLAPLLFDRLPGHDLLIVGMGPELGRLQSLARSLGVAHRVHFARLRDDVPAILRASDLLALPSRWEGMPNALLEAMASGLPVVATEVEGVRETLADAAKEQTVPSGKAEAMLNRLAEIAGNSDVRARLGRENRRIVEARFPLSRTITSYETLYESLAGPKPARSGSNDVAME